MKARFNANWLHRDIKELGPEIAILTFVMGFVLSWPFAVPAWAQAQAPPVTQQGGSGVPAPKDAVQSQQNPQGTGTINGTVVGPSGAMAVGARVRLTRAGQAQPQEMSSGQDGQFSFANSPPGRFQLTVTAPGFKTEQFSGVLQPGATFTVPKIALHITPATTNVRVGGSAAEIAEVEVKQEEKQRVLGVVPNFYVTYSPNAPPMAASQKFRLAFRTLVDPITVLGVGSLAGIQQAADDYPGFGQGAEGYAKRFGAAYATHFTGTMLDRAVLPVIFKQDPRYFYQGTGTTRSRILHALSYAVIRRGDNGQTQPNYSGIIGSFASGGISYLYYPPSVRNSSSGAGLLVQNSLVGIAGYGISGLFQEFVLRKFTSHSKNNPGHP